MKFYQSKKSILGATVALGAILASMAASNCAWAQDILYDGTNTGVLANDPTGSSSSYESLYFLGDTAGHKVTVDGSGATWSTAGTINAPYVIYGGIDVGASETGTSGTDIANNVVTVRNVAYDWSGQVAGAGFQSDVGGMGGGSIYGGLSIGGSGDASTWVGGDGGIVGNNTVMVTGVTITGAAGGSGGIGGFQGGSGVGGMGGGSVYGGLSIGGAGGVMGGIGGAGSAVSGNLVVLTDVVLVGAQGGQSGGYNGGGVGGMGGGSVYGGISIGGTGSLVLTGNTEGGDGGAVNGNTVTLAEVTLTGAAGGSLLGSGSGYVGGGVGGMGGGSVYGGLSIGGAGGWRNSGNDNSIGGTGGGVSGNTVTLTDVTLTGAAGGAGGGGHGGGVGGMGGGSVYGGLSIGGAGGNASASSIGGSGGAVSGNVVILTDVTLVGAEGGAGGAGTIGGVGGMEGGSVYGGLSIGGAGTGGGGNGGSVTGNKISLFGKTSISGDVYGGYSHGGAGGGNGGSATGNTVTLTGTETSIGKDVAGVFTNGSLYGGWSVNGDGSVNTSFDRVVAGNTLNLIGYRGSLGSIHNFENYHYILPKDVVNNDTLVHITGTGPVDLTGTRHTVGAMYNDGNRLTVGDTVILIDKVVNTPVLADVQVEQGHFIVYDMSMQQEQKNGQDALVLTVKGWQDGDDGDDGGYLNPKSKAFSEGRIAMLAMVNQGSDLIADYGIRATRSIVREARTQGRTSFLPFLITNGGSSRYSTGSHVDLDSFAMAGGVAAGFEAGQGHLVTMGAFFEHGSGSYDSYSNFSNGTFARGYGDTDYTGGGILARVEFSGTGLGRAGNLPQDAVDGLYLEGVVRAGSSSLDFDSNDLTDMEGYRGRYDGDSSYLAVQGSLGYVFNFDDRQALDLYGRYTWTRLDGDTVLVGKDTLRFDLSESSRLRIGARYSYVWSDRFKPYIGAAYEHEFKGDIQARAYGMSLERPSLSGHAGIFETGFALQPLVNNPAFTIDLRAQGFIGDRRGGKGSILMRYEF